MTAQRKTILALAIIALAQTAVLAYMVFDRARLLSTGREITLPIVPIDPRDLFRGEYVRLGYDISRIPVSLLDGPPPRRNEPFYVTLERKDGGDAWQPVKVTQKRPDVTAPERIVLKGRSLHRDWADAGAANATPFVRYGIERYFVPQGQGPELEKLAREKKLAALVAVDGSGNAAIKGLIVDGKLSYQEPLF